MGWIRQTAIIAVPALLFSIQARGQVFETGVNLNAGIIHSNGFELGGNGFSLNGTYLHSMSAGLMIYGGAEFGITGWGSHVLFPLGIRWGEMHQVDLELINGMALYRQGNQYVAGAGAYYVHAFFTSGRHRLVVSAGLRFTIQPAYKEYSSIYYYLDLPLRIRFR
jgi:hypothetical protein